MKVTLADPVVEIDGWLPEMEQLGQYTLKVRKTPEEMREERELKRQRYGAGAFKVVNFRSLQRTCISHQDGREDVAYFLPGLWPRVKAWLEQRNVQYELVDRRNPEIRPPLDMSAFEGVEFRAKQDVLMALVATSDCGIIDTPTAFGKCQDPDTKILMYDGSIKRAGDIQVGDRLMGDDSTPRTVLSVTRGYGPMYRYKPSRGCEYRFNGDHVLTTFYAGQPSCRYCGRSVKHHDIVDISVSEYMNLSASKRKMLYAYRTGVEFPEREAPRTDPYLLGRRMRERMKHDRNFSVDELCWSGIPRKLLLGSRDTRLRFLAGILDAGSAFVVCRRYGFELSTRIDDFADELVFLAGSLGLCASKRKFSVNVKGFSYEYCRVYIGGDISVIPSRKYARHCRVHHVRKDRNHVGFSIVPDGEGEYVGFMTDGNHRYVLGDFTVTHNSFCVSMLCKAYPNLRIVVTTGSVQVVKTLYEYLCKQIPGEVGILGGGLSRVDGKRVVVSTLKSLDNIRPDWAQLVLVDECHQVGTGESGQALMRFCWARRFGFSASVHRNDGSDLFLESLLGPVILKMDYQEAVDAGSVVPLKYCMLPCAGCPPIAKNRDLPDYMLRRMSYWVNRSRNNAIRQFVYALKRVSDCQILIMVNTLEAAINLHMLLPWFKVAYYGNTDLDEMASKFPKDKYPNVDLRQYKITQKQVDILRNAFAKGTIRYAISTKIFRQGCNFPHLRCLIRADGDVSSIEGIQIPGRLARLDEGKDCAYLVDIDDQFSPWAHNRSQARERLYDQMKWQKVGIEEVLDGLRDRTEGDGGEPAVEPG